MFIRKEIIGNLHGCLDVALFMPNPHKRFADSYDAMVRSFAIPILCFPITLMLLYASPPPYAVNASEHAIASSYALRIIFSWAFYFGFVYWITRELDRKKHFYQFVTATNWLCVISTLVFLPIILLVKNEVYAWAELQVLAYGMLGYVCLMTAHMASRVLKAPWEIGGLIVVIGTIVDSSSADLVHWVNDKIFL